MGEHILEHWLDSGHGDRLGDALHVDVLLLFPVRIECEVGRGIFRRRIDNMRGQHLPHLLWRLLAGHWWQHGGLSLSLSQRQ